MKKIKFKLPTISIYQEDELKEFLETICGYEFDIEHYQTENHDPKELISQSKLRYIPYPTIKIINNQFISIEL
ncbi:hypothetical protein QTO16_17635, partial [Vibrio harveyi]|uniref:hypothetical protein n=1 Tax=Vibrio harveyi TaxID=669 RepID=UPI002F3E6C10